MTGKTLGLIGLGAIGKLVAAKVKGFEMPVLAYDEFKDTAYAAANGIEYVDLETLLRKSDFISVHVPLLPSTTKMISGPAVRSDEENRGDSEHRRGRIID
jgi:D-3-phosphoglycerate dehydrogenase